MTSRGFHHATLPGYSTLLSGREPRDSLGWQSDRLQVWYNDTEEGWVDDGSHSHTQSDEMFIVLEGSIVVEVDGDRVTVGAGEFCCFPPGVSHRIIATNPPLKTLMLRAPLVEDKISPA